jgi:hypothetical protein
VAAALAAAMLVLTRPGSVLVLGALSLLPWLRLRQTGCLPSLLRSAVVLALGAAVLWPTLAHNHERAGGWTLSTNNERNFFLGNNPYTHPYKTGHLAQRGLDELPPATQTYLLAHYRAPDPRQAMLASAKDFILTHPLAFVQRCFNRFVNFWAFDYEQGRRLQKHLQDQGKLAWLPMLAQALFSAGLIWLLGLGLPALWRSEARWPALGLLGVCLVYQAPHVLAFASPVYRAGLAPLITALAAGGACLMWRPQQAAVAGRPSWAYAIGLTAALLALNAQAAYYLVTLQ